METTSPLEPGDFLEDAISAWKPGSQTAREVVATACMMAGYHPPFGGLPLRELVTVAEDLIDNDTRLYNQGEQ